MHDDNRNKIQLEKIPKADLEGNVKVEAKGFTLARIVVAFWILGMCNNYIYVIMLSAAHDIITKVEGEHEPHADNATVTAVPTVEGRNCTDLTAGAILLADIIPTLVVKLICPFLPFYVHFRLLLAIVTGILSLVLVATSESMIMAIVGVCFASFNSGLGEITLLAYSTNFVLHAIAGWSSGTGGAGLAGSFAYAGMTESGLSPPTALFISISVPLLMAVAFWIILKHPEKEKNFFASGDSLNPSETRLTLNRDEINDEELSEAEEVSSDSQCGLLVEPALSLRFKAQQQYTCLCKRNGLKKTFIDKICFIPVILPYMIPVGLVYYFEYLINSGLFDKLVFTNTTMTKASQFRWYNAMYQVGVFVSRSSVTWVHFKRIWIMSILQGLNVIVFTLEAIYGFIPNVWFMFALIFWEGLLGGAAYVNTFYNMSYMVRKDQRLFALSIASVADTFGIVFAGLSSFPVHDALCKLPFKPLFRWPE